MHLVANNISYVSIHSFLYNKWHNTIFLTSSGYELEFSLPHVYIVYNSASVYIVHIFKILDGFFYLNVFWY